MSKLLPRSLGASVLSALVLTSAVAIPARAADSDYRFEVVRPVETSGEASRRGSTVTVALIAPSGRRVTDAEVFRRETIWREKGPVRIDERQIPLAPDGQGNYRLTTYYPLTAGTTLKLGAHVPGETGTVRGIARVSHVR